MLELVSYSVVFNRKSQINFFDCLLPTGEGHAEANAVRDAKESGNEHLLKDSIVYSTLEPCHPFEGKRTPRKSILLTCNYLTSIIQDTSIITKYFI